MSEKNYIVFNIDEKILRTGGCPGFLMEAQAHGEDEYVIEGKADDAVDKIEIEEFDVFGNPSKVKIKKKTEVELDAEKPVELPESKRRAVITKEKYQNLLDRLKKLDEQYEDLLKRIAELENR